MNMKRLLIVFTVLILSGCAISPQSLTVAPALMFENLKGVSVPVELIIKDKRNNEKLLGYRNAKKQGEIGFSDSVAKSLGEKIQAALIYQGVDMATGEDSATKLEIQVYKLNYFTPDESWVSTIEMNAEILVAVNRGGASVKKRFKSHRKQDVVIAPNKEFNEKFMNTLLSELLNKALNDKEIVNFLK